ncbi:hypothetical protein ACUXG4_001856 [Cupriavidus metallidurans]
MSLASFTRDEMRAGAQHEKAPWQRLDGNAATAPGWQTTLVRQSFSNAAFSLTLSTIVSPAPLTACTSSSFTASFIV